MNNQILKQYIDQYKLKFEQVNKAEIYKWKAVKCFQDNWNIEAENFYDMLKSSLKLIQNLLYSYQYFPLTMLEDYAKQRPNEVRQLFRNLYNEEEDIYDRIKNFQSGIKAVHEELLLGNKNTYQDSRAIVVYLVMRYPERYYFYKFGMYNQFAEKLECTYKPVKGHIENIGNFNYVCQTVRDELSKDQELLKLHKNRITDDCYYDASLNILTQDFIYAVAKYLTLTNPPDTLINTPPIITNVLSTEVICAPQQISFQGRVVNYIQNDIENKRIGDLGEQWVMKYEIDKLKTADKHKLAAIVKHTSKDEGDGTGFDIQSFDTKGNKIFIEVKTTKATKNATFYVTRNELERSQKEKDKYYLYRLFNYNERLDTADLLIIEGELTGLCDFPMTYKINMIDE
jgi:hypothetical protein